MASIKLKGDTSGELTIQAPSVAGTNTLNLPASSGTLLTTTGNGSQLTGLPNSYAGTKNLIINGNMQIAQRATSATGISASGYQTVDRFIFSISSIGTYTLSQDTDVPAGQGFSKSSKLLCTTADASPAADDVLTVIQKIEAHNCQYLKFGTANAESLTLSFWVKSNKTGTYVLMMYRPDGGRLLSKTYTIDSADTWEKKTITVDGDATGVIIDDNGEGFNLYWHLADGTNRTSGTPNTNWGAYSTPNEAAGQTVNLSDAINNYINITGVQLEVGTTATDFENLQYTTQLQLCQRYYQEYGGAYLIGGYQPGASEDYRRETFPVTMRATPTASSAGTWATTGTSNTKPNIAAGSNNGVTIYAVTTGGTWYMDANSVDDKLIFSAEL